jgi:Ca2+-binding EF-hand superfamily protein
MKELVLASMSCETLLQAVLREMGEDPTSDQVAGMIKDADANNDGTVDYKEFCAM